MDASTADKPSKGFAIGFVAVSPSQDEDDTIPPCTSDFTLDHYRVVLNDDHQPTTPTDGKVFKRSTALGFDALVHRSQREFYGRIYACDDVACDDVWGDDSCETLNDPDDLAQDTTEQEVWLFEGVSDDGDTTSRVTTEQGAPAVFFFPEIDDASG